MMDEDKYNKARNSFLRENCEALLRLEERTTDTLIKNLLNIAEKIKCDFDQAIELRSFWEKYAPAQRGHKPCGEAFPWGEVGEKVVEGHLYSLISRIFGDFRFIGVPYGHDIRFATGSAFIHIDAKSTGPTDNQDEVVSSPNQVTGNGKLDDDGRVCNSIIEMRGSRVTREFQPELAPFFILDDKAIPTLTYYLKIVYSVESLGVQPLEYLELISVPNGLALFDGPNLNKRIKGLFTPGKDETKVIRKRTRIKLEPLSSLDNWRCQKIKFTKGKAYIEKRSS